MLARSCFGLVAAFWFVAAAQAAEPRPNIIFIMADDLGNADLGYRGGEVKTPKVGIPFIPPIRRDWRKCWV